MAGLLGIIKCPPEVLDLERAVGIVVCLSPATVRLHRDKHGEQGDR